MNIFISFSGQASREFACTLRDWLPNVIQDLKAWCSQRDIRSGRWNPQIAQEIQDAKFGIVCLMAENLYAPWLNFEAGALAGSLKDDSRLIPYLIDLKPEDIPHRSPFADFTLKIADEAGTLDVLTILNQARAQPLEHTRLDRQFRSLWPDLNAALQKARTESTQQARPRTELEVLTDLEQVARETNQRTNRIETIVTQIANSNNPDNAEFELSDVITCFAQIRYLSQDAISKLAPDLKKDLNSNGIRTRAHLRGFMQSSEILLWLENIYKRVLLRPANEPLDPTAVAVWGGMLSTNSARRSEIRSRLCYSIPRNITRSIRSRCCSVMYTSAVDNVITGDAGYVTVSMDGFLSARE